MTIDTDEEKLSLIDFIDVSQPAIPFPNDPFGDAEKRHLLWGYASQDSPVDPGLGRDISGRNNHWTVNDIIQQLTDTPTNNFPTLNPVATSATTPATITTKKGNLKANTTGNYGNIKGTFLIPRGAKVFIAYKFDGTNFFDWHRPGIINSLWNIETEVATASPNMWSSWNEPANHLRIHHNGLDFDMDTGAPFTADDYNVWAVDTIEGKLWVGFYRVSNQTMYWSDNAGNPTGDPATGANPTWLIDINQTYSFAEFLNQAGDGGTWHFGAFDDLSSMIPDGFILLNTQNIEAFLNVDVVDGENAHYVKTRAGVTQPITVFGGCSHKTDFAFTGMGTSSIKLLESGGYFNGSDIQAFRTSEFCIEGKFKFDNLSIGYQIYLLLKWNATGDNREWYFSYTPITQELAFGYSTNGVNSNEIKVSHTLNIDTEYHLACLRDGNTLRFKVNGVQVGIGDLTGIDIADKTSGVFVGSTNPAGNYFDANCDDLRITVGDSVYPGSNSFTVPSRFNTRNADIKFLVQSRDMPDGNTEISDHDIISDAKFPVENDKALATIKATDGTQYWTNARREKKAVYFNDSLEEQDRYDDQVQFLANAINGVALGNNNNVSRGQNYLDWIMNGQDPLKYGIEMILRTGTGSNATTLHNGGQVPSMRWTKALTDIDSWHVYHKYMDSVNPDQYAMTLNTNQSRQGPSAVYFWKAPTATEYYTGTDGALNKSGILYLDVLFFDIPFLQSAFIYETNDDMNGPFITLDHLSHLILGKSRASNTESWWLHDIKRSPYNPSRERLRIDLPDAADVVSNGIDINACGVKIMRGTAYNGVGPIIGFSFGTHGPLANAR